MRILEEFWYGNIEPTEYDTSSCKEYKKLLPKKSAARSTQSLAAMRARTASSASWSASRRESLQIS